MVQTAGSIMILGIGSFFDMKWKKIPSALFLAGAVWAAVCVLLRIPQEGAVEALTQAAVSLLPGAALLILSFMTEKKVGAGDGLTLLLLGLYEGMELALGVFCLGLFLQSLLAFCWRPDWSGWDCKAERSETGWERASGENGKREVAGENGKGEALGNGTPILRWKRY